VEKFVLRRQEAIKNQLRAKVNMPYVAQSTPNSLEEFSIPGGVFISQNHCWISLEPNGNVKIGIDDFAKQLIGEIDGIELPNLGMEVKNNQPLFIIKQGKRSIPIHSPVGGKVFKTNNHLTKNLYSLDTSPYGNNWICTLEADDLNTDIPKFKIGKSAVSFYQEEIESFQKHMNQLPLNDNESQYLLSHQNGKKVYSINIQNLSDNNWQKIIDKCIYDKN
jgi:glycine cleavage system H lipoate-binding protein